MSFEGNWQLTIDSPMGERPASLSITETIGNLEGSLTTGMGTAPVSGHADEDFVAFSASVQGPMGAVKLDFTGTVTGDEVSGEMQFGSMGGGRWNGARIGAEEGENPAPGSSRAAQGENAQSAAGPARGSGTGGMRSAPATTGTMDQPTGQGVWLLQAHCRPEAHLQLPGGDVLQEPVDRLSAADGRHADAAIHRGLLHL